MPKYINAEDLMNWLYAQKLLTILDKEGKAVFSTYMKIQRKIASADVVNIVRCKDCKKQNECGLYVDSEPEWFCADGERRKG